PASRQSHRYALKQRRLAVRRYARPCARVVFVRVGVARDFGGIDLVGLAILGAGQVRFLFAAERVGQRIALAVPGVLDQLLLGVLKALGLAAATFADGAVRRVEVLVGAHAA